ncbi:MAG: VWA domain-containing protein [Vicinamibacterales bacterium]
MTRLAIGLSFCVCLCTALVAGQQAPVFRGETDVVPVYATVTDASDRLVTTLTRDDFQILDNGKPQPLTLFDNSPRPIRLIVLLDVSGSMGGNLPVLRVASDELFRRLGPEDRARLGSFGKQISLGPEFTNDLNVLRGAMPTTIDPNAPTPMWRAMDEAIGALAGLGERRVVLVLSDSKDSGFQMGQKFLGQVDVVERARREDVMIYGVGLRGRDVDARNLAGGFPDPGLGTAALETGGGYFELRGKTDLASTFARVADELHSQYLLGFAPPARDGKRHKLEVRVTTKGLTPRARKDYVAPKS